MFAWMRRSLGARTRAVQMTGMKPPAVAVRNGKKGTREGAFFGQWTIRTD
jgi:hypothetical protein